MPLTQDLKLLHAKKMQLTIAERDRRPLAYVYEYQRKKKQRWQAKQRRECHGKQKRP